MSQPICTCPQHTCWWLFVISTSSAKLGGNLGYRQSHHWYINIHHRIVYNTIAYKYIIHNEHIHNEKPLYNNLLKNRYGKCGTSKVFRILFGHNKGWNTPACYDIDEKDWLQKAAWFHLNKLFKVGKSTLHFNIYFNFYSCVYLCACVWMSGTCVRAPVGAQKRVLGSLELEIVVSHLAWVLRNELGSSKRKASVLNHWAIFPSTKCTVFGIWIADPWSQESLKGIPIFESTFASNTKYINNISTTNKLTLIFKMIDTSSLKLNLLI